MSTPLSVLNLGLKRQWSLHICSSWRALLAGILIVLAGNTTFVAWKANEFTMSAGSWNTANIAPPSSHASDSFGGKSFATSTGTNLHMPVCGVTWEQYYAQLPPANPDDDDNRPFQWTISGGDAYRDYLSMILEKWKTLGLDPVLLVALDEKTAERACQLGFSAVHWNAPSASYSRVADSKFEVAASIADRGYRGFFIEMDVFCRRNPVPLFLNQHQDLIHGGHGDVGFYSNIGTFMASRKMGPFFRGLRSVLRYSLDKSEFIDHTNMTKEFFDQDVYFHCLPPQGQNGDDDVVFSYPEYYLSNDTDRTHDLLRHCQQFKNFTHMHLPHHLMSNYNPPTVYDTTYCIHPLFPVPFTPIALKMGVAKYLGWDPEPIDRDEKFLKLASGDIESHDCWNRCFMRATRMDEDTSDNKISMYISALVEMAIQTNRTLILPQFIRDKESWALPTHGIVNVATLGVPYRYMARQEAFDLREKDTAVVQAAKNFSETFRRVTDEKYRDVTFLSITKICNIRDYKLEVLEMRRTMIGWCFLNDQAWTRGFGGWMSFCDSEVA
jgi:hypothetical protein